jgi:energy-coupling factor transporter ATP-binding protein EcfA2
MAAAIRLQNVSKCFRRHFHARPTTLKTYLLRECWQRRQRLCEVTWAVQDISLDVERGTTMGIVGRNGSGKSTLRQLMRGVFRPTNGSVWIGGKRSAEGGLVRQPHTIARPARCSGVGLHTGCAAIVTVHPAPPDTGLVFFLKAGRERVPLPASVFNLQPAQLCTALGGNGASVKSVEHLPSALHGLDIDNAFIELDAPEVPAMDGSAGPFVRLIKEAGIVPQGRRRPVLKILRPRQIPDIPIPEISTVIR